MQWGPQRFFITLNYDRRISVSKQMRNSDSIHISGNNVASTFQWVCDVWIWMLNIWVWINEFSTPFVATPTYERCDFRFRRCAISLTGYNVVHQCICDRNSIARNIMSHNHKECAWYVCMWFRVYLSPHRLLNATYSTVRSLIARCAHKVTLCILHVTRHAPKVIA